MSRSSSISFALILLVAACGDSSTGAHDGSVPSSLDQGNLDGGLDGASDASQNNGVTTLRVHYPATGHTIAVRGDTSPLDWNGGASASPVGTDTYEYVITLPASAAQVQWKPLLDDTTWAHGPNFIAKRGETVDVYPHFTTQVGTVSQLFTSFHSTVLNNDRVVWVYLPPSYNENTDATYPVLYMHDGQNLFDSQPTFGTNGWRVDNTLNAAAETGSIREIIVVAPENAGVKREYEYTPTYDPSEMDGGGGDMYLQMLVTELKPQVDAMLRTQPARATTGILGSSLGGLISAYAGVKKADTYGIVGALSPSTWWDTDVIVTDVAGMTTPRPDRVYVDYGTPSDGGDETVKLVAAYRALGYVDGTSFLNVTAPGMHSETYWAMRLPGALAFLFGPRTP